MSIHGITCPLLIISGNNIDCHNEIFYYADCKNPEHEEAIRTVENFLSIRNNTDSYEIIYEYLDDGSSILLRDLENLGVTIQDVIANHPALGIAYSALMPDNTPCVVVEENGSCSIIYKTK